jgi:hypothetical protein
MRPKGHAGSLYTSDVRKPYYKDALPSRLRIDGGLLECSSTKQDENLTDRLFLLLSLAAYRYKN